MASSKISQLQGGTAPQAADLHVLARGGTNKNLTTELLFNHQLGLPTFQQQIANQQLIAGRWYRVTDCGPNYDRVGLVLATANNGFSRQVVLLTSGGPCWADWEDLEQEPVRITDDRGNVFFNLYQYGGDVPAPNQINAHGCFFNGSDGAELYGLGDYTGYTTRWNAYAGGILNFVSTTDCDFSNSWVDNSTGGTLVLLNSKVVNGSITKNQQLDATLVNCELFNATVNFGGGAACQLNNCSFSNCTLNVLNGATVDGLTIDGKKFDGDEQPSYTIDGTYQNQVLNNWAGHVVADRHRGTSTVRFLLVENDNNEPGTWDRLSRAIYLLPGSVVGEYLLPDTVNSVTNELQYLNTADDYRWHSVQLRWYDNSVNGSSLSVVWLASYGSVSGTNELITYHGRTPQVGQLIHRGDFVELRAVYYNELGGYAWNLIYGCHYDS